MPSASVAQSSSVSAPQHSHTTRRAWHPPHSTAAPSLASTNPRRLSRLFPRALQHPSRGQYAPFSSSSSSSHMVSSSPEGKKKKNERSVNHSHQTKKRGVTDCVRWRRLALAPRCRRRHRRRASRAARLRASSCAAATPAASRASSCAATCAPLAASPSRASRAASRRPASRPQAPAPLLPRRKCAPAAAACAPSSPSRAASTASAPSAPPTPAAAVPSAPLPLPLLQLQMQHQHLQHQYPLHPQQQWRLQQPQAAIPLPQLFLPSVCPNASPTTLPAPTRTSLLIPLQLQLQQNVPGVLQRCHHSSRNNSREDNWTSGTGALGTCHRARVQHGPQARTSSRGPRARSTAWSRS